VPGARDAVWCPWAKHLNLMKSGNLKGSVNVGIKEGENEQYPRITRMLQLVSQMVRSFNGGTLQCRWTFRWLDLIIVCHRLSIFFHIPIPFPVYTLIRDRLWLGLFISRPSPKRCNASYLSTVHRPTYVRPCFYESNPASTSCQSTLVLTRQISEQLPSPNQSLHPLTHYKVGKSYALCIQ
jgi:hypothetical protein